MRTLLLLYLCAYAARAQDDLEYDDYDVSVLVKLLKISSLISDQWKFSHIMIVILYYQIRNSLLLNITF